MFDDLDKEYFVEASNFNSKYRLKSFYFKSIDRYVHVSLFCVGSIYDQPQRRECNSFVGGNSLFGAMFSWSFNFRDVAKEIVSCDECSKKLSTGLDTQDCDKCYNWNINHNKTQCSKEAKKKLITIAQNHSNYVLNYKKKTQNECISK